MTPRPLLLVAGRFCLVVAVLLTVAAFAAVTR